MTLYFINIFGSHRARIYAGSIYLNIICRVTDSSRANAIIPLVTLMIIIKGTHKESIPAINSQVEGRVVEAEALRMEGEVLDSTKVISAIVSSGQL